MNAPPIDRQTISLPSAAAIVVLTFGIGAGWTTHEARFEAQERRLAALEKSLERQERLMNRACIKLQCDAEGMRE